MVGEYGFLVEGDGIAESEEGEDAGDDPDACIRGVHKAYFGYAEGCFFLVVSGFWDLVSLGVAGGWVGWRLGGGWVEVG